MAVSLSDQMAEILNEYVEEVVQVTNDSIDKTAKESVKKLKSSSPSQSGDYAKGWTLKKEKGPKGVITVTVHNKTQYQLTHLLENGHVIRNSKGEYGRAPAIKHIAPVEEWACDELTAEIERELK